MKAGLSTVLLGLGMGFVLSRIGFSSWDAVHAMFTFDDLRMFLAFCSAVVLLALSWRLIVHFSRSQAPFRRRLIHRGTLLGGLLFGAGWALSGACPASVLVQIGEGQLGAGYTLLGIFAGNWLYGILHARYLHWDTGSCVHE